MRNNLIWLSLAIIVFLEIAVIGFIAPTLISAKSDVSVIGGFVLLAITVIGGLSVAYNLARKLN